MKNSEENISKLNKYFEYRDTISVDIVDLVIIKNMELFRVEQRR